jgi:hypothetical protein
MRGIGTWYASLAFCITVCDPAISLSENTCVYLPHFNQIHIKSFPNCWTISQMNGFMKENFSKCKHINVCMYVCHTCSTYNFSLHKRFKSNFTCSPKIWFLHNCDDHDAEVIPNANQQIHRSQPPHRALASG